MFRAIACNELQISALCGLLSAVATLDTVELRASVVSGQETIRLSGCVFVGSTAYVWIVFSFLNASELCRIRHLQTSPRSDLVRKPNQLSSFAIWIVHWEEVIFCINCRAIQNGLANRWHAKLLRLGCLLTVDGMGARPCNFGLLCLGEDTR